MIHLFNRFLNRQLPEEMLENIAELRMSPEVVASGMAECPPKASFDRAPDAACGAPLPCRDLCDAVPATPGALLDEAEVARTRTPGSHDPARSRR
jgi:hypothetical protein